jgi:hypothetical protein
MSSQNGDGRSNLQRALIIKLLRYTLDDLAQISRPSAYLLDMSILNLEQEETAGNDIREN